LAVYRNALLLILLKRVQRRDGSRVAGMKRVDVRRLQRQTREVSCDGVGRRYRPWERDANERAQRKAIDQNVTSWGDLGGEKFAGMTAGVGFETAVLGERSTAITRIRLLPRVYSRVSVKF